MFKKVLIHERGCTSVKKLPATGAITKNKNLHPELVRPLRLRLIDDFKKNWILYLMILPVLIYLSLIHI